MSDNNNFLNDDIETLDLSDIPEAIAAMEETGVIKPIAEIKEAEAKQVKEEETTEEKAKQEEVKEALVESEDTKEVSEQTDETLSWDAIHEDMTEAPEDNVASQGEEPPKDDGDDDPKKKLTSQDRRLLRQKRRQTNRIIAFTVFFVLVALIAIGSIIGAKTVSKNSDKNEPVAVIEEITPAVTEPVIDMTPLITQEAEEEEKEEPTPEVQSEEELLEEMVTNMISEMTLEEKVAGLFIVTPESLTGQSAVTKAGDGTKEALEKYPVGGVVYFKQNITSADQIKEMIDNTVSYSRYPLFIAVDEEGGDVARIQQALKLDKIPTAAELGEENNTITTFDAYNSIGKYMKEYGFNLDFAPVADVLTNPDNKAIGNRSFGSDADVVTNMVSSAVKGLDDAGVYTCVKHFPGQGDVDGDTHQTLASTTKTKTDMENCELLSFKAAIESGVDMIMVGHFSAPALTEEPLPCSISKEVMTDLLRVEMGYNGVIITDSMSMAAISEYYGADEAAIKALKAGADMILMPEDFELAYNGVIDAVNNGTIDEHRINDSLARVYKVKYKDTLQSEE